MNAHQKRRRTAIARASVGTDPAYHAVMPPIYLSSTFQLDGIGEKGKYEYSRTRNPTRDSLADIITELEGGAGACITASGMAALTLILHLLNPDDLLLAPYDCYGRSHRLLQALADKRHFKLRFIDQYNEAPLRAAFADRPRMVLVETPSNPLMRIADITMIAGLARECGALTVCDNTFLSPMLQQPLSLGADIVFHSTTKFLNGHSDVVGGCVVARNDVLVQDLEFWANSLGLIGAPFDSYMTLRGLRTLELRIHRTQENATALAHTLAGHKAVEKVHYPGLPSHPGYEIAQRQQEGPGAMLALELKGGEEAARRFVKSLKFFSLAQSLGGTESLINHPATMTHLSMGAEARAKAGIKDGLLRLSVGIEHIDDLRRDLLQALDTL